MDVHVDFLDGDLSLRPQLRRALSYEPGAVVLDSCLRAEIAMVSDFFESNKVPTVQVGHVAHTPNCDAVVIDNYNAARMAVQHFAAAGHTRIATIRLWADSDPASPEKHAGFLAAMAEASIPINPQYIVEHPMRGTGAWPTRAVVRQLLGLPEPPTAVFVENSYLSGPLLCPEAADINALPADIAELDIIHFEASDLDPFEQIMFRKMSYPPRSVKLLRIDWKEVGKVAARRILKRVEGAAGTGEVVRICPRLIHLRGFEETLLSPGGPRK